MQYKVLSNHIKRPKHSCLLWITTLEGEAKTLLSKRRSRHDSRSNGNLLKGNNGANLTVYDGRVNGNSTVRFVELTIWITGFKVCDVFAQIPGSSASSKECDKFALFFVEKINSIRSVSPPVDSPHSCPDSATCLLHYIDMVNHMNISSSPVHVLPTHFLKEALAQSLHIIIDSYLSSGSVS